MQKTSNKNDKHLDMSKWILNVQDNDTNVIFAFAIYRSKVHNIILISKE